MKPILATLFLLTIAAPAWGQDFERGLEAYEQRDYATALRELRPLAEQGHAAAQVKLGEMYFNGQGVEQDIAEALKWLWKAADQGHAGAQDVSGLLDEGLNYVEAAEWYRKAAEQGDADAQYNLGFLYARGEGVLQDFVQAHMWYNLAASRVPPGDDRDRAVKNRDKVAKRMTPAQPK